MDDTTKIIVGMIGGVVTAVIAQLIIKKLNIAKLQKQQMMKKQEVILWS